MAKVIDPVEIVVVSDLIFVQRPIHVHVIIYSLGAHALIVVIARKCLGAVGMKVEIERNIVKCKRDLCDKAQKLFLFILFMAISPLPRRISD